MVVLRVHMLTPHLALGRSIQGQGKREKILCEYPASSTPQKKRKGKNKNQRRATQSYFFFFLENCWRDQTTIQSQE